MDTALLILRLVVGLYFVAHGSQKLFGWFGGSGINGLAGWLASMRFRPAGLWARAVGTAEALGGLLLVTGFLSPVGSLMIASSMMTAIIAVRLARGWFATNQGVELELTYLTAVIVLALAGPGRYSLDRVIGLSIPATVGVALAIITLLGVAFAFAIRTPAAEPEAAQVLRSSTAR